MGYKSLSWRCAVGLTAYRHLHAQSNTSFDSAALPLVGFGEWNVALLPMYRRIRTSIGFLCCGPPSLSHFWCISDDDHDDSPSRWNPHCEPASSSERPWIHLLAATFSLWVFFNRQRGRSSLRGTTSVHYRPAGAPLVCSGVRHASTTAELITINDLERNLHTVNDRVFQVPAVWVHVIKWLRELPRRCLQPG